MRRRFRLWLLRFLGALLTHFVRKPRSQAQRILVIKPDHLGDVLLLTPALRLLRRQRPDAQITLLIGPWSSIAVRHNPDIDTILTCPFPGFTRTAKPHPLQPYATLLKTALLLRSGRFDAALIARDDHWWGALLAVLAGIPQRIGFALPETAPFLSAALPHSFADHVTDQNLALVAALTDQPVAIRPAMRAPTNATDHNWATAWLQAHNVPFGASLIAIQPGAGGGAKLWLAHRWAVVADALAADAFVVLTGGPDERELLQSIADRMAQPPLIISGEATLGQLAALFSRCVLVLGVDSGPLHLAVAAGAPTLALFGPGDWQRFGPWGDPQRQRVVRSGLWCSPCGVLTACPRGTAPSECMALIPTQTVLAEAAHMLKTG